MNLFRRLVGAGQRPPSRWASEAEDRPTWMREGTQVQLYEGREDLEVVGESHYQEHLWRVVGAPGSTPEPVRLDIYAVLVAETDNPHDPNAISVWINGLKVGHLSRETAQQYRPGLLALERQHGTPIALLGVIAGGGMREEGPGRLGVFLRHDPADFGVRTPPPRRRGVGVRTGLTDATTTDAADDPYDLAWVADLPDDPIRAISTLRQLLESERDPLDRHFMFNHLEKALYRSRNAFTSALDEYDDCCRRHDAEMETIREAFMAKWGEIPWLPTYKQMCIRLAKAKRFEEAIRWAERGLAIYGENAARPDAVEDLRRRLGAYRAKLAPPESRHARRKPPGAPEMETLTCASCGREFQRLRKPGRKPTRCPNCRETAERSET